MRGDDPTLVAPLVQPPLPRASPTKFFNFVGPDQGRGKTGEAGFRGAGRPAGPKSTHEKHLVFRGARNAFRAARSADSAPVHHAVMRGSGRMVTRRVTEGVICRMEYPRHRLVPPTKFFWNFAGPGRRSPSPRAEPLGRNLCQTRQNAKAFCHPERSRKEIA